jgi:hypothetical protein
MLGRKESDPSFFPEAVLEELDLLAAKNVKVISFEAEVGLIRYRRRASIAVEDSVLQGPTTPQTFERATFIVPSAKLISPHFKRNNSL